VCVPGIRMVDAEEGVLGLELIDGKAVRQILPSGGDDDDDDDGGPLDDDIESQSLHEEIPGESSDDTTDSVKEFGVTHG
jgi:TP53 regulating kinase and related kinases